MQFADSMKLDLRIGFYAGESNKAAYVDAAKVSGSNAIVIMHIQAYLIWPLLHPQYSQSERAASAMLLAGYILHELCVSLKSNSSILHLCSTMLTCLSLAACYQKYVALITTSLKICCVFDFPY